MARNEKRKKITYVFFHTYMKYSKLWSAEFSWAQTSYFWRVTVKYRQLLSCSNVISISILNNEKKLGYHVMWTKWKNFKIQTVLWWNENK